MNTLAQVRTQTTALTKLVRPHGFCLHTRGGHGRRGRGLQQAVGAPAALAHAVDGGHADLQQQHVVCTQVRTVGMCVSMCAYVCMIALGMFACTRV